MLDKAQLHYKTDLLYKDREGRAKYIADKYAPILTSGTLLDVGAGQCHLRKYLPAAMKFTGVDLAPEADLRLNLEKEPLPFEAGSFDVVTCIDVLEHLENLHSMFDDICRITARYTLIALPTPWVDLYRVWCWGGEQSAQSLKFYGLPAEPPEDRHKWFFSLSEAEEFIRRRAELNNMNIVQMDTESWKDEPGGWKRKLRHLARKYLMRAILPHDLYAYRLWALLEKKS